MNKNGRFASRICARRFWISIAILAAFYCLLSVGARIIPSAAARQQVDDSSRITLTAWQQISELIREKESRTVEQRKIDSQLLYAMKLAGGDRIGAAVPSLKAETISPDDGKVVVDISCKLGGYLLEEIGTLGVRS